MNCKHKLLKRKVNQSYIFNKDLELIQIWDYRTGDYNDVYSSIDVRGTYSQLKEMCDSAIKSQNYRLVDSNGYDDYYVIDHLNKYGDVDFYAEATSQGTDKTDLRRWTSFVDLVKEND